MEIRYAQRAQDDLKALPKDMQKRIAKKMRFYASQQDPTRFAKRLVNFDEGMFRFRVGDYRVFFDVERDVLFVLKISHRSRAY